MSGLAVREALAQAHARGLERLDAHLLLGHVLSRSRTWLLSHDEYLLSAEAAGRWHHLIDRRLGGEPLAYLVGEKEFHGLNLCVSPAVLIPRPDTETLVAWALERLQAMAGASAPPRVIDLGTGSGAIALALKQAHPDAVLTAVDASEAALAVARHNAERHALDVDFQHGHWWADLPHGRYHLAVSNPPYIAEADAHLPALRHEPRMALTSGPEGLDDLRHIIEGAPARLEAGGWLLLEHGFDQADAVQGLLAQHGFADIQTKSDLAGRARCTGGRWLTPQA